MCHERVVASVFVDRYTAGEAAQCVAEWVTVPLRWRAIPVIVVVDWAFVHDR